MHFDSTDHMLVAKTKAILGIIGQMSEADILSDLQQAHIASDEYYTMAHVAAWNTTFVQYGPRSGMEHDLRIPS